MAKITPTTYLEAPTVSSITPNDEFTTAVYVESSYSFTSHSKTVQLKLLDLSSNESSILIEDDASLTAPAWLNNKQIVWLSEKSSGNTAVMVADVQNIKEQYTAGTIPGPASSVKVKPLKSGEVAIAFAVKANPDGTIYNPHDVHKPLTSAKYYTSAAVRLWSTFTTSQRNAIFYGALEATGDRKFSLSSIWNACPSKVECPIPPFGGHDSFDLCQDGIVLVARTPDLDPSLHTKCDCFFTPVPDFKRPGGRSIKISVGDLEGAAQSPVFSPSGTSLALLKMKRDRHEADFQRILLIENFASDSRVTELSTEGWDLSASSVQFYDDNTLLIQAHEVGKLCAYTMPIKGGAPRRLSHTGSLIAAESAAAGKLLIAQSTFCQPAFVEVLDSLDSKPSTAINLTRQLLSPSQVSDIWYEGAQGRKVHALIMKPSSFDTAKSYPVCFLVHGGPQHLFVDTWDSHFQVIPQLFAEAGYIVVMPQFTGSRGYGQPFMDAIAKDWGGAPYQDIVASFDYIKSSFPAADTSRAILGGLSYGGYMTNWIQGHDLGREFKALFTLNGIFSSDMFLATDELFFAWADLGGLPWHSAETRAIWQANDPSAHMGNWATPQLIVHSEKDFRCGIEHGISAFNVLQAKGVPSAFMNFEDEAHIFTNPENIRALYQGIFNFVNPYVGLEGPGEGPGEEKILPVREI